MTTDSTVPAPPIDPELAAAWALQMPEHPSPITAEDIAHKRRDDDAAARAAVAAIDAAGLVRSDHHVESFDGAQVVVSIVHRPDRAPTSPFVYYIHGGGMMLGTRWSSSEVFVDWIDRYNAVVATVEYRRAPEHPFPVPQEDCYAVLCWLHDHQPELGINLSAGIVAGISAGAGLSAAVTLMARDRQGPRIGGQLLLAPMLDDRNASVSARQYPTGVWNASENELGWRSLLGGAHKQDDVPPFAAPARAADLSGLPPAFVEVGSAEVFRDEAVGFASRIWAAGGRAELHVWSGAFHGFQALTHTAVAQGAASAMHNWLQRHLVSTGG